MQKHSKDTYITCEGTKYIYEYKNMSIGSRHAGINPCPITLNKKNMCKHHH